MTEAFWELGIAELTERFRSGRCSPTGVLEAVLERASEVEPKINAFAFLDREGARSAAAASTARWRAGTALGPLDGVPITIKDNITVAGMPCAWGSQAFVDYRPPRDEIAVGRLRNAGAVILGKTNVSEFTVGPGGTVNTEAFGTTRNPWNTDLTTGSSSGGGVAATASGIGLAALATDGGGSIRRPASYCNLVGLKPSTGRVARYGGLPLILGEYEVIGPIARTTADLAIFLAAIAGPDPRDRASLAFSQAPLSSALSEPGRKRILFVPRFGDAPVDEPIAAACAEAARRLAILGHEVVDGSLPFDSGLFDRNWPLFTEVGLAWALRDHSWEGRISRNHVDMVGRGREHRAVDYVAALADFRELQAAVGQMFQEYDLLMTPTAGAMPWRAAEFGPSHHRTFTGFANVAGVPAITIPCEPSAAGVPIGVQLVAAFGEDARLLDMAAQFERAYPWAERRPSI